MVKIMDKIEEIVEEIREHEDYMEYPELWEALAEIEDDEVYSVDVDTFNILGNIEVDDVELQRLIEELYDLAYLRAELWEFAMNLEKDIPAIGPTLEVHAGRVEPVWDGRTLAMEGVDEYIHAELLTFEDMDPDPTMIIDEIDDYMDP